MNELYRRLAERLNSLPIPFPSTESGVELKILEKWFTEEEAEIALAMTGLPETVELIAGRAGRDPETLGPFLESMSRRGLIFRISKGEHRLYNLAPLAEGMWEFHLDNTDDETFELLREYRDHFMEKGWYGTQTTQHRIVPIGSAVTPDMEIMPYDRAEEIIRAQKKIAVTRCICRTEGRRLGHGCEHELETCMAFGTGAYFYLENGLGREISTDEALAILKKSMEAGLVIQPGNGQKAWNLCMCCGCCCALLNSLQKMPRPAEVAHTNFHAAVIEENCTSCGLCAERCPMDAISVENAAVINLDRCIGCGVCVGACDYGALALHQKPEARRYVPPADVTDMQIRIAKERGLI